MSQHTQRPPNECGSCQKIHSILRQHKLRALGQPPTGAAIATGAGISRRKALVHVAYMVECGWLEADGRTPVIPVPATPATAVASEQRSVLRWAADLALSCRTCGRLMVVLASQAGGAWSVQMGQSDIASALGISERRTRDHLAALTGRRPHARHPQSGPLLRGERLPETGGRGGLLWVFLDGVARPGSLAEFYSREEYAELRHTALEILSQVPLITSGMNARERTSAAELLVIPRLHVGYPPAVLLAAITDPGDFEGVVRVHAYGMIRWRLRERCPETGYVATLKETLDTTPVVRDCAGGCGRPIKDTLAVTHCVDCRRREAAGITLDVALETDARRLRVMRWMAEATS
ncbi:hypothetical protein ACIQM4_34440 [Streptomyces sp. NPDC091272]|uniref:hypothetical protein n=1 Tax=Streptomyces sp. NPDC091272 TaxID=3365981 RepID=UPI0038068B8D